MSNKVTVPLLELLKTSPEEKGRDWNMLNLAIMFVKRTIHKDCNGDIGVKAL
jgi:hypothetical protein